MFNRVLLVDDSKSARFALRKLLERTGFQVDVAENAEEALDYLDTNHPDLIFMDHFMPGMDGFGAAKAIKERPDKSEIPIVMCTSKDGENYKRQAFENGAVDILPKPATPGALNEVLDNLKENIEKRKAETQGESVEVAEANAQLSEDKPEVQQQAAVPTLNDVVVPVEKIQEVAEKSARTILDESLEHRLSDLLEAQLPKLRESVMDNFDKIAKLMLKERVAKEVSKVQEQMQPVEMPLPELPEILKKDEIENIVEAQVQQLQEQIQREVNEQFAEIYSTIGDLKANQNLKKIAPELMDDILFRAKESATESANDTLLEVSEISQKIAVQAAEEVCKKSTVELKDQLDQRVSKSLETGLESARHEAAESAWQKGEEATNKIHAKIAKLYLLSGVSLIIAAGSLISVIYYIR